MQEQAYNESRKLLYKMMETIEEILNMPMYGINGGVEWQFLDTFIISHVERLNIKKSL